jgi:hypothetical protein
MGVYKEELALFEDLRKRQGKIAEAQGKQGIYLPKGNDLPDNSMTHGEMRQTRTAINILKGTAEYIIKKRTFWRWSFLVPFEYDNGIRGVNLIVIWHQEKNGREWFEITDKQRTWGAKQ